MPLLLTLKTAWERRNEIVLGLLIIACMLLYCAAVRIHALKGALAAQPEEHSVLAEHSSLSVRRGPVKVTRTFAPPVAGCEPVLLSVVEERAPVEIDKNTEKTVKTDKVPVLPDFMHEPRRIVGVSLDLYDPKKVREIHAGYSFFGRLDAAYSFALEGPASSRHGIILSYRF